MRRIGLLGVLAGCLVATAPAAAQDVTIYSSLPLIGPERATSQDIVHAEQLALEQAGGRVGPVGVRFVSLNDATHEANGWEPGQTSRNARIAAEDDTTIAYLGDFNSGASAISVPITNEAGILAVSPANGYVGLTRRGGADRGEPDKYYPTGVRTYGRVVPADHLQAAALARYLETLGVRRVFVVDDLEVFGTSIARLVRARLAGRGIRLVGSAHLRLRGRNAASVARRIRRSGADAMVYGGIPRNGAARLWRSVHARNHRLKLLGADGIATAAFAHALSRAERARTVLTSAPLAPAAYPPAGQAFLAVFRARFGHEPAPYAIFGYEAMSVVLAAMSRAQRPNARADVVAQFFATRDRDSVLGRYSIDPNGDTTLSTFGGYAISPTGALVFARVLNSAD
jgi:branched-chain amino acid transport system substrate-binding protein